MTTPATLVLGAMACLLLALALWMFARARRREHEQTISRHLRRSLERGRDRSSPTTSTPVLALPPKDGGSQPARIPAAVQWIHRKLGVDAWGLSPRTPAVLLASVLTLFLLATSQGGLAIGLLALVLYVLLLIFFIWRRLTMRRNKLLQQLPGFLDNMVRMISIGNSPHAAFQLALGNVPAPLGDALQQAAAMLSASPDLGQAMAQLERSWRLPEFGLLAAVFRMSVRYGGRADLVLERVSAYIRDRQSAERELHALSSEIRLSAWVLALLPVGVGALIMILNQGYFLRMWNDASGQRMVLLAIGLEGVGALLLYRLAQLR